MTSPGTVEPTDNERETAWRLLHSGGLDSFRADVIAQHLADQRARYEAVADELANLALAYPKAADGSHDAGVTKAADYAARLIREVSG